MQSVVEQVEMGIAKLEPLLIVLVLGVLLLFVLWLLMTVLCRLYAKYFGRRDKYSAIEIAR